MSELRKISLTIISIATLGNIFMFSLSKAAIAHSESARQATETYPGLVQEPEPVNPKLYPIKEKQRVPEPTTALALMLLSPLVVWVKR